MIKKFFLAALTLFAALIMADQSASAATHRHHHGRHFSAGHARSLHARMSPGHSHRRFASRRLARQAARGVGRGHHRHIAAEAAPAASQQAMQENAQQPMATGLGLLTLGVVAPIQQVETGARVAARSVAAGVVQTVRRVVGGTQIGGASYYGGRNRTASGGHVGSATCAHRSLPFGTRVLVTNLSNARQAVLTVNDRGPFVRGRIVDVSTTAAGTLGMLHSGTARVSLQVVGRPG